MTESRSLTVDKGLIERLQPRICCSESMATCRDDEFCASRPEEWQGVSMWSFIQSLIEGKKETAPPKVRLLYPEDDDVPSLPGPVEFCSAYMSWYTRTGCGALAKEIANSLEGVNHCLLSSNFDDVINRVLKKVPRRQRRRVERALRESLTKVQAIFLSVVLKLNVSISSRASISLSFSRRNRFKPSWGISPIKFKIVFLSRTEIQHSSCATASVWRQPR